MKKFYITGVSGTGKTTSGQHLMEKGIPSFDIGTVPGLCYWRNKVTKESAVYTAGAKKDWFESHERFCDPEKLQEILEKENGVRVVTGTASNQDEYLHLFDKVFLLQCKPETFVYRLQTRSTNAFAGTPHEQELVIEWQKTFDKHLLELGAIPISSEGPVEKVVDVLMKIIQEN